MSSEGLSGKIGRRFALKALGVGGAGIALSQVGAVTGHAAAWGATSEQYPVKPYTLNPPALEAFSMMERLHVRIDGVGEDVINLSGIAVFHRNAATLSKEAAAAGLPLTFATAVTTAEFRSIQAVGESSVFGRVRVSSSGREQERAIVRPNVRSRKAFADGKPTSVTPDQECAASISPTIEFESLGDSAHLGEETATLGSQVSCIPPVGDVARTEGRHVLYASSDGRRIGTLLAADIEIGPVVHRVAVSSSS